MTDIAQAHARLLHEGAIQVRFPDPEVAAPVPPVDPHAAWMVARVIDLLFWPVVVLIGVVLLVVLVRFVWRGDFRRPGRVAAAVAAAEPVRAVAAPVDEEALARAGQYGAAVHALLLRCIEAISRRFPRVLRPAHTGREIAGLEALPAEWRAAFAGIAAPSERAVFAGRALGREEWEACRALAAELLAPAGPA